MKEAPGSSETSVLTRTTWRNNPEDTVLYSHRRENLKSYMNSLSISSQCASVAGIVPTSQILVTLMKEKFLRNVGSYMSHTA
jgi:hypothetical protein